MTTTKDHFENRLLLELQTVVRAHPAPAPVAAVNRHRGRLSLAAAVGTVAATVVAFTLGGGGSPAFAVGTDPDGSVTVTISSLKDAAGLQRALIDAGVPAVVDYTPQGKACQQPRFTPAQPAGPQFSGVATARDGSATFTLGKGQLAPGQTLVIETSVGQNMSSIGLGFAQGQVAPCELVDAPALPAPQGQSDSGPSLTTGTGPASGTQSQAG